MRYRRFELTLIGGYRKIIYGFSYYGAVIESDVSLFDIVGWREITP